MSTSIHVDGVTKRFRIANTKSMKTLAVDKVKRQHRTREFVALNDISFKLEEGESIGLMGLNGSGKSTLLKLISGVMAPDEGQVWVRGKVAGLIEVGAGLHPDLTGRQNVYLNCAILGMTESEINRKFDSIVEFSGIEKFLDTEVRHYSSGMFARLGFATAVHTDCDVFLIDEVLAVGDQPFRRKCMQRIRELKAEGRTMVYVSHNPKQVLKLCNRGLLLEAGEMVYEGSAEEAVKRLGYELDDDEMDDDTEV